MTPAVLEIDLDPVLAGRGFHVIDRDLFGCDKRPYSLREIDGRNLLVGEQNRIDTDLCTAVALEPDLQLERRPDKASSRRRIEYNDRGAERNTV